MGTHEMIRKITGIMLAVLMAATLFAGAVFAEDIEEDFDEDIEESFDEEEEIIGASPSLVESNVNLEGYTLIYTYDDMLKIKEEPSGRYKLMNDIDFAGEKWDPVNFSGTFDGSGFAVLNATVGSVTRDRRKTYDGNMVEYDTAFAGFFGIVEDAEIRNFSLYGLNVDIHTKADCFAGGMAGYTDNSVIKNCTIDGTVSLYIDAHQIGVGGAVGFGNGEILNCTIDTTLICVDENVEDKDEQFMGGVNANGYMSIDSCDITIRGYDSDHGYVHDGGLSGMFIVYPEDNEYYAFLSNNRVSGFITFFEDNEDRRAYCERGIGEDMSETFDAYGNEYDFEADERFEYDTVLLPHDCEDPTYTEETASDICPDYGHKVYTCDECGYSYKADYTGSTHTPIDFVVINEATETEEGLRTGKCALCDINVYEKVAYEPPTTEEETATSAQPAAESEPVTEPVSRAEPTVDPSFTGKNIVARVIVIAILALLAALVIFILVILNRRKKERERLRRMKEERRRARKK